MGNALPVYRDKKEAAVSAQQSTQKGKFSRYVCVPLCIPYSKLELFDAAKVTV